jgi:hypothetical protein
MLHDVQMLATSLLRSRGRRRSHWLGQAVLLACAVTALVATSTTVEAGDWRVHIDWAFNNTDAGGSVDCPNFYYPHYGWCVISGGRACLSQVAKGAAWVQQDYYAFSLMLITQCHNPDGQRDLISAGPTAVADYIRRTK